MAAAAASGTSTGTRSTGSIAAAASKNNVTSFQRRGPRASSTDSGSSRLVSIAGTRPSVRNGQLLVSTGLPALDQLLGRLRTEIGAQQRDNLGRGLTGRATLTPYLSLSDPVTFERGEDSPVRKDGGEEVLHGDFQMLITKPVLVLPLSILVPAHQPFSRLLRAFTLVKGNN